MNIKVIMHLSFARGAHYLNYTVGEKELLDIIEGLKAFENILQGQDIIVHTNHLNLLYAKNAS